MPIAEEESRHFDLTPHPRILPMLGEIVLPQWRCIAELIDNSIDSFIEANREGNPVRNPTIVVTIPTALSPGSRLSVRDNGPGMDSFTLERAAKAGWTSHDPINNLGLFGMGFNIATARLGLRTIIWTTRAGDSEWVGLEINFEHLTRQEAFVVPGFTRPKQNSSASGTEVVVEQLKLDQLEWFSKSYNRSNISKQLGKIYSSMIGLASTPIGFVLEVNGTQVRPKQHCIWGGPGNSERSVETARHGTVNAFQPFDVRLDSRPFCIQCWNWLGPNQVECPDCEKAGSIIQRERRIHGWLGIQRYLDRNEYGIDILRNGRKIEVGNKDLFKWIDESANSEVTEYPVDDPRDRGRIVGEVHLDHCRVPYTKDRFVREDAAWQEMVQIVRGNSPLRPDIAAQMGSSENRSPLYRLFQAFRRSNPHNKRAGGWGRILVVPDNDRAQEMSRRFDSGDINYQSDEMWWELVEEAEAAVLLGGNRTPDQGETLAGNGDDVGGDAFGDESENDETGQFGRSDGSSGGAPPTRLRLPSLSREYSDDLTGQRFEVEALAVEPVDPIIADQQCPWTIRRTTSGPWEFFVNPNAPVFRSMTLTPFDALLTELSWQIADFERGQGSRWAFGSIFVALREKYATSMTLDPQDLISDASAQLTEIARCAVNKVTVDESQRFFQEILQSLKEHIRLKMAARGVPDPDKAIADGRFLQYSPPSVISLFVQTFPALYFDGNYWDEPYISLDYDNDTATESARLGLLNYYTGLLTDVVWLSEQSPDDLELINRDRLMHASLATSLLSPTVNTGEPE